MKHFFPVVCAMIFLVACQPEQRYFESSAEIDIAKKIVQLHNDKDYDPMQEFYADTAQFYYNSLTPMNYEEMVAEMKQGDALFSESGFTDDVDYEMVITDEGNTWVGVWGVWKAKFAATGQEFSQPTHVSAKFVDGKIVEEWGYWDNAPVLEAMMKLQMQEADAQEAEGETEGEGSMEEME